MHAYNTDECTPENPEGKAYSEPPSIREFTDRDRKNAEAWDQKKERFGEHTLELVDILYGPLADIASGAGKGIFAKAPRDTLALVAKAGEQGAWLWNFVFGDPPTKESAAEVEAGAGSAGSASDSKRIYEHGSDSGGSDIGGSDTQVEGGQQGRPLKYD